MTLTAKVPARGGPTTLEDSNMTTTYEDVIPGADGWRYRIGTAAELYVTNADPEQQTVRMDRKDGLGSAFALDDLPTFTADDDADTTIERLRAVAARLDERHPRGSQS